MELDKTAYFRDELKRKLKDKRNFLIESDRAVVIKADYPKSQYHFRVVAKEELRDITQLNGDHLPLLDHMMDLANQIIEKQEHLESRNFRIGFKAHTFWNRLNLHVISDDFYSMAMKRPRHWNSFNTELFMPFQMVHMMLSLQGFIEPISDERLKELQLQKPFRCNQCDFVTDLLLELKAHLYSHWQRKEGEREQKKKTDKIIQMLDEAKIDTAEKPAEPMEDGVQIHLGAEISQNPNLRNPFLTPQQQQAQQQADNGYDNYMYGPPVNMMNQPNPNNPFRNTPPLNIQSMTPPQPLTFNYRQPGYMPRGPIQHQGPRAPWNGPRFPPGQHQSHFRHPGFNVFRPPPPANLQGGHQYPNQGFFGQGAGPSGQQNGTRPKWTPRNVLHNNQQNPNQQFQQPNQNHNQQNRPYSSQQNRQNQYQQNKQTQNPQNAQQAQPPNQVNRQNTNNQNRQNPNQQNRPNPNQNNQNKNKKLANQKKPQQPAGNPNQGAQVPTPTTNPKSAGT
ncbi:hypothetical protein M5D96_002153 [Drosophila gunungcola]|uniref:Aprataxin C2HE/C2H2/C2HC zinc finger domain-containing protein n=2 Tax=Drosophila gunungcola TaxID=103775 RepID=A0A9Q0BV84_9MUSC|nr:hypothetical protein M5D96_002153 [Drosophila gunungcola]